MQSQPKNLFWADNLRALATLAVILLHTSAPLLPRYANAPLNYWWFANVLDGSSRFCVPIFLMLTGALILPKSYTLLNFFKKRLTRILLPFLFWSIIYIIYFYYRSLPTNSSFNTESFFYFALNRLKNGAAYHLWYVYTIIGIYLIFPILQKWIINKSKNYIIYVLIIWLLAVAISFPVANQFWPKVNLFYFLGLLGYTLLGYYLAHQFKAKHSKLIAILSIAIGSTVTVVGTYYITERAGLFQSGFYNYLSLNVILSSAGIFLLFMQFEIKSKAWLTIISLISKYSFGIYLAHILVLKILNENGIAWNYINPYIGIPLCSLLCLLISLLITYIIHKIPFGKHISG